MSRSRSWCFTINHYDEEDGARIQEMTARYRYIVAGKEVGESGTPHIQGYVYLKNAMTMGALSRLLPRAHLEMARGTPQQAADYCKKDGDYWEDGELPASQSEKGEAEKARWEDARTKAKAGDMDAIPADIYIRCYNSLLAIGRQHQPMPESRAELDNLWYYGPTGTGKSRKAREENPGYYLKNKNKWWDGYTGQEVVIIEEWDPSYSMLGSFLKEWADHYPFNAEFKGSSRLIRPKKIIVTSNYSIDECFVDEATREPLHRRFTSHHFTLPFDKPT